jgi:uncharacterized protein YndB with AHSA1/START domain
VFKAWTEPAHLARWWGPKGFTNPICEVDLRVGGAWRIVMRAPNGAEYPGGGVYREIVKPERLVFTNSAWTRKATPSSMDSPLSHSPPTAIRRNSRCGRERLP